MTQRERFEDWAKSVGFGLELRADCEYAYVATHSAWRGWQAAQPQVPDEVRTAAERFNSPGHYRQADALTLANFAAKVITEQTQ